MPREGELRHTRSFYCRLTKGKVAATSGRAGVL
jgi:hypothetical protein